MSIAQSGSFVNSMMGRSVKGEPVPVVGMGCTVLAYSDRHAATIVEIVLKKGKVERIAVQRDNARRTDNNGMSESQEYEYTPDPRTFKSWFKKDPKGFWIELAYNEKTKRYNQTKGGYGLRIGKREEYYDFTR